MSSTKTITSFLDTEVREAHASTNYGNLKLVTVNGGGSSDARRAFFYCSRPFPLGATILSATLRLRINGSWSGTNDLTAKRVTAKWAESTVTWTNKPATTATNSASHTISSGADKAVCDFDIKNMMQDVANGGAFFGWQVALSQHANRAFYSSEYPTTSLRPELIIQWSVAPNASDKLAPDGDETGSPPGDAVSVSYPKLRWNFSDADATTGTSSQSSSQVQLNLTTDDFTSPTYDTGKIANTSTLWDSNDGTFTGVTAADVWYWRVKVWDDSDLPSAWSESAVFNRTDLSSLSITSPSSTTGDLSPTTTWSFGGTQQRWSVYLSRVETSGKLTLLWSKHGTDSTTDAVTVPEGYVKTGSTYRLEVRVWDNVPRYNDEYVSDTQDFTYVRADVPDPVTSLAAVAYADGEGKTGAVSITWSRSSAPDYFCLSVDSVEELPRLSVSDTYVSGTNYQLVYWGLTPRQAHTLSIEAVVLSGGVLEHSHTNPSVTFTPTPIGIWLADDSVPGKYPGNHVGIYGNDSADVGIGETGTTFDVIGARAPVRITDIVRGYEGSITGVVLSLDDRDSFLLLKATDGDLRLILGDLNIPIRLEEVKIAPTPTPGDYEFTVEMSFVQTGEPWPITLSNAT